MAAEPFPFHLLAHGGYKVQRELIFKDEDNSNTSADGRRKVSVMTGVTTGELMEFQLHHGVNLPCNVVL